MTRIPLRPFRPTLLAVALAAAFSPAFAADEEKKEEKKDTAVEASVTVGAGVVSGSEADQALFGQYHSFAARRDFGPLLGIDYSLRRPETATWVDFQASDLLGSQREMNVLYKKVGDWRIGARYSELTRREPHAVIDPTGAESRLQTKRTGLGFNYWRSLSRALKFEADVKHEEKKGSRLFGHGFACPSAYAPGCLPGSLIATGSAVLLTPEPIDASHTQVETRLAYAEGNLRFALGYYGSFYRNDLGSLVSGVGGTLNNAVGTALPLSAGLQSLLNQPIALPPDNQAHQVDFSGSYDFTPATRSTFKVAYGRASQNDSFAGMGLTSAPAGVTSLDAEVHTLMARVGVTSRLSKTVTLNGDLRYENREDKTPLALYNVEGTAAYTNRLLPYEKIKGRVNGAWQVSNDWRASAGAEYESIDRGQYTATSAVGGISALRQETEEFTVWAEARRRMGESVSGSVKLSSSRRDGSNWLRDNSGRGVTEVSDDQLPANTVLMPTLADRQRDKVKAFVDWQPTDELSLQAGAEWGQDDYDQVTAYGLEKTSFGQVSLDATYAINERWNVNGYVSWGRQALNQAKREGYIMALRNESATLGVNVTGRVNPKLEVGGGLSYMDDRTEHRQTLDPLASPANATLLAAAGGLPDITFRQTTLRLFAKYQLDPKSSLRGDLAYQRTRWNDWAWQYNGAPFTFSDGTTLSLQPTQSLWYLGVTYQRQF
jgi:MtrB/PioB family decaheme-associated outer membrane protein